MEISIHVRVRERRHELGILLLIKAELFACFWGPSFIDFLVFELDLHLLLDLSEAVELFHASCGFLIGLRGRLRALCFLCFNHVLTSDKLLVDLKYYGFSAMTE